MKAHLLMFLFLLLTILSLPAKADQYDTDRHQMKLMMVDIENKLNQKQFDAIMPYLDKNAVITFYDARTVVGIPAIEQYFEKMVTGTHPVLKDYVIQGKEDVPAIVYPNNTAIAYGWAKNTFDFVSGNKLEVDGRWTVSLIKEGTEWKIVALHFSTNLFKNPLIAAAKRTLWWFLAIALIVGLIIGYLISMLIMRRRIGPSLR